MKAGDEDEAGNQRWREEISLARESAEIMRFVGGGDDLRRRFGEKPDVGGRWSSTGKMTAWSSKC